MNKASEEVCERTGEKRDGRTQQSFATATGACASIESRRPPTEGCTALRPDSSLVQNHMTCSDSVSLSSGLRHLPMILSASLATYLTWPDLTWPAFTLAVTGRAWWLPLTRFGPMFSTKIHQRPSLTLLVWSVSLTFYYHILIFFFLLTTVCLCDRVETTTRD